MASKKKSSKTDYEVLPRDEILELRDKINRYTKSKNPMLEDINDLRGRMDNLTEHIQTINSIFETAQDELELENKQQDFMDKIYKPMAAKVDSVLEQNQIIATALLNIVDMFKENQQQLLNEISNLKKKLNQKGSLMTHPSSQMNKDMSNYESKFVTNAVPEFNTMSQKINVNPQMVQPQPSSRINNSSNERVNNFSNQRVNMGRPLPQNLNQQRTTISPPPNNNNNNNKRKVPEVKKKSLFSDLFK